jgi:hypothetical protein
MAQTALSAEHASLARKILGRDFISPQEIAAARGLRYSLQRLAHFGQTLPCREALEGCRDNGMMLVAGPPMPTSLVDVRALHADSFYAKGPDHHDACWYDDETFAKTDKVEALTWIALRKEAVVSSFSKSWSEQRALVQEPMVIPNVAEVAWALTTYKVVRDVYLLEDLYVRTSSVDAHGRHVFVGAFDADGLGVYSHWGGERYSRLGVSAARKF